MISIVIPAYNEEKTIGLCLDSLLRQKTDKKFEVIVINNNSTDKTVSIAKRYKDRLSLSCLLEKKKGAGNARARGFNEAKGDIILSTDADTVLPENWIETMTKPFKNKSVVATTTLCNIDEPSRLKRAIYICSSKAAMYFFRMMMGHYWLSGFSYAVRRNAYERAGKINTAQPSLDDVDLSIRISKQGKIIFIKDMYVKSSSRRYKDGLVKGLLSYTIPTFEIVVLKKNVSAMKDYR